MSIRARRPDTSGHTSPRRDAVREGQCARAVGVSTSPSSGRSVVNKRLSPVLLCTLALAVAPSTSATVPVASCAYVAYQSKVPGLKPWVSVCPGQIVSVDSTVPSGEVAVKSATDTI
jgi:hypothetical protein